jgi:hypothetical protein
LACLLALLGCAQGSGRTRSEFDPKGAPAFSINDLNQLVRTGKPRLYPPQGVKVSGIVATRYQGGPVDKEVLGVADSRAPAGSAAAVWCLRQIPPGGSAVAVGDKVTVVGRIGHSSAANNVFLDECSLVSVTPKDPPRGKR